MWFFSVGSLKRLCQKLFRKMAAFLQAEREGDKKKMHGYPQLDLCTVQRVTVASQDAQRQLRKLLDPEHVELIFKLHLIEVYFNIILNI